MRPASWVAITVALALLVAGCGGEEGGASDSTVTANPSSRSSAPSAPADTAQLETAPMEQLTGGEQNPAEEAPTWDAAAEEAAADRAVAFMRAFARPELPAEQWHAGIAGLMSPGGAELFAYVDPANVPASEVTGEVEVLDPSSGSLAEVHVATDAGTYLVTLTRINQADPWLVEYADPVE